jgi:hypothetical protein
LEPVGRPLGMPYISWHSVACLALLQADANHLLFHQFRLWFHNWRLKKKNVSRL